MLHEELCKIVEARRCEFLYLPAYLRDLSPIEEAFSKIKVLLRRAEARTRGALVESVGRALSVVAARDMRVYFERCSLRASVQSL